MEKIILEFISTIHNDSPSPSPSSSSSSSPSSSPSSSDGSGSGYGYGYGEGYGSGYGYGYGCGYGSGIKRINNCDIYMIDDMQTIITKIKNNIAKGFILNSDLTLTPCYVIKRDNLFAHGKTLKEAREALQEKIFKNLNIEERIDLFLNEFSLNKRYSGHKFYNWHNKLTGSCKMGRDAFVKDNDIDLDKTFTVSEFITIVERSYGDNIIKQLKEKINERK